MIQTRHWWEKDEHRWPSYCLTNASGHQANMHPSPPHRSNSIVLATPPFNVSTPFYGWKMPHTLWLPMMLTRQCRSSLWDKKILISPVALFWPTSLPCPSHGERRLFLKPNISDIIKVLLYPPPPHTHTLLGSREVMWKNTIRHLVDVGCLQGALVSLVPLSNV